MQIFISKPTLKYSCVLEIYSSDCSWLFIGFFLSSGWGGSGGIDACACGTSGTCEGPAGAKCNCDLEDGQSRSDDGWIYDKTRLPVCEVCITLDPTTPVMTSRTAAYVVSNLHCNSGPIGEILALVYCSFVLCLKSRQNNILLLSIVIYLQYFIVNSMKTIWYYILVIHFVNKYI